MSVPVPLRRFLNRPAGQRIACALLAWYVRLVFHTSRWEFVGFESLWAHCRQEGPLVLLLWHERLMMMPCAWRSEHRRLEILVSAHRDGRLVSGVMARFGVGSIAISSKQGGVGPARAVLRALREGVCVGITPDGPRGPRRHMKAGATALAGLGGRPVYVAAYAARRRLVLKSWDRLCVPLPFNRGVFVCEAGATPDPAALATPEAREALRADLEQRLNHVTARADRLMGHAPHGEDARAAPLSPKTGG